MKSDQKNDTHQEEKPSDTGQHQGKDAVSGQIVTVPNLSKDSTQRPDHDGVDSKNMHIAEEAIQDGVLQKEVGNGDRTQEGEDDSSDSIWVDARMLLNHRAQAEQGCYGDPRSVENQSTQHQKMGEPEIDFVFPLQYYAHLVHAHRDHSYGNVQHQRKQSHQSQGRLRELMTPREHQTYVQSTTDHVAGVQTETYGSRCLLPVDEAPSKQNPGTLEGIGDDPGCIRPRRRCDSNARTLYSLSDGKVESNARGIAPPGIEADTHFGQVERGEQKQRQKLANDSHTRRLSLLVHAIALSEGQSATPHS